MHVRPLRCEMKQVPAGLTPALRYDVLPETIVYYREEEDSFEVIVWTHGNQISRHVHLSMMPQRWKKCLARSIRGFKRYDGPACDKLILRVGAWALYNEL